MSHPIELEPQPSHVPGSALTFELKNVSVWYGKMMAVHDLTMDIPTNQITALIGPSGCGKSTLLRCLNQLNLLIKDTRVTGTIYLDRQNIGLIDPIALRRRVGMVFQRPNPFPTSIYENIALGLRINGFRGIVSDRVEYALRQVGLWEEVKHRLKKSALILSGGQQQRLCIARALALQPQVLLLDEPCAFLDPIASMHINQLLNQLKHSYTIVIVTHNLQQAARIADMVGYMNIVSRGKERVGSLIEYASVIQIFNQPCHDSTNAYLRSRAY
jgi:phosphate transport system ATP-binding protein